MSDKGLSQEVLQEAEECFAIFSKQGVLSAELLGTAIRSLGFNPSNAEIQKIIDDTGAMRGGISFQTFKTILSKNLPAPDSPETIREAFGIFDKDGTGTIPGSELKHVLMTLGEKLSEEEVDAIIKDANVDADGLIQYEQFVRIMVGN